MGQATTFLFSLETVRPLLPPGQCLRKSPLQNKPTKEIFYPLLWGIVEIPGEEDKPNWGYSKKRIFKEK